MSILLKPTFQEIRNSFCMEEYNKYILEVKKKALNNPLIQDKWNIHAKTIRKNNNPQ